MQAFACTRLGGWIHFIGFVGGQEGGSQTPLLATLLSKNIYLRGVLIGPRVQCVFPNINVMKRNQTNAL